MKTIKMDSWYLVEAIYSRSGATLGAGRCLGKDIEREKRSLRTLRPEGAADETAEGWYGRLKFVIEDAATRITVYKESDGYRQALQRAQED